MPLYNCTPTPKPARSATIGAEKLPWASHLATFGTTNYIVIEGVKVAHPLRRRRMRAGRNPGHGHRLGRRLDRQHDRNRHIQLDHAERDQNRTESARPENRMERPLPDRSIPVAQRTGAERLLASPAKSASAGVDPGARARGALARRLRRGSSADRQSTSSSRHAGRRAKGAAAAGAKAARAPGKDGARQRRRGRPRAAHAPPAAPPRGSGPPAAAGQKHGPRIAQPKGAPEQAPTPAEIANATVADMRLESPAIAASAGAPRPPGRHLHLRRRRQLARAALAGVPAGTAELALFVMNVQPVEEKLFVDWARGRPRPRPRRKSKPASCPRARSSAPTASASAATRSAPPAAGKSTCSPSTRCPRSSRPKRASTRATCAKRCSTSRATSASCRRSTRAAERARQKASSSIPKHKQE